MKTISSSKGKKTPDQNVLCSKPVRGRKGFLASLVISPGQTTPCGIVHREQENPRIVVFPRRKRKDGPTVARLIRHGEGLWELLVQHGRSFTSVKGRVSGNLQPA